MGVVFRLKLAPGHVAEVHLSLMEQVCFQDHCIEI
jgi:hypothetical protein